MCDYRFTPSPIPLFCPVCKKEFEPDKNRATPYFYFVNKSSYASVNMCFECAESVLEHIQEINPEIIPGKE